MERSTQHRGLVRCLDCGTRYRLVIEEDEVVSCPGCGGIGWISLEATGDTDEDDDS